MKIEWLYYKVKWTSEQRNYHRQRGHQIWIKGKVHQEDTEILNVCVATQ